MSVIANETSAVVPDWCVPCILRVRVLERLPFHLENHCRVFRGVALGRVGTVNCSSLHEMNSVKTGCITTVLRNRRSRNEVYPESLSFLTVSVQCTGKNKKKKDEIRRTRELFIKYVHVLIASGVAWGGTPHNCILERVMWPFPLDDKMLMF